MRKLITLSLFAFVMSSCSNVAKHTEAIETLSSSWEASTSQVSAAVSQITEAQDRAKAALQSMTPPEGMVLADEQSAKVEELQQEVQAQMGQLGALAQQAFEFVNQWQEEGEKLETLETGLEEGKLPADVQSTIDSLKSLVSTAGEKVADWESEASAAKKAVNAAIQSYNEALSRQ